MNKTPCAIGDIVAITILDHAQGDHLLRFTLYGRVAIITTDALTVDCWHYAQGHERDDNVERFTVALAVVENIRVMT